jgi:hypothetical protein
MSWTEGVTLGIALLGAVLGIINICHQLNRDRLKLKVIPKIGFVMGGGILAGDRRNSMVDALVRTGNPARLCIEVINLSSFAVTISDVGFGLVRDGPRHSLINPEISAGKKWPTRLKPRESMTAYAPVGTKIDPAVMRRPVAYAATDCDRVRYGSSPIFKEYMRQLRAGRARG